MTSKHILLRALAAVSAWSLLFAGIVISSGCGGGGNVPRVSPSPNNVGRATFTVAWPAYEPSRLIPSASNSIRITITKTEGSFLAEKVMERPSGGAGGVTTTAFSNLPVGSVIATASALPTADGSGTIQATASAAVTIVGGQNADLSLTMNSTITRLEVSPLPLSLASGNSATLTVTAKNNAGNIVLIDPAKITFASTNSVVATVDSAGKVVAGSVGSGTLTITETESGHTTTVPIDVMPSFVDQVVTLLNEERAKVGLAPLKIDARLARAAQLHADDMKEYNYFSHTDRNGGQPWDRTQAQGYPRNTYIGENIAGAFKTPAEVMQAWMNSPGHRDNILNANYRSIGVGYNPQYWVQVFGGV
ncbi:MAG: CAP domain-containing protein [Armatimonadota bacterium]